MYLKKNKYSIPADITTIFYYFAPLLQCNKMRNILNGLRIYIYCH